MRNDKVFYKLIVKDIQDVASEFLERKLTNKEIELVADKVGDFIPWFDAIQNAIISCELKQEQQ